MYWHLFIGEEIGNGKSDATLRSVIHNFLDYIKVNPAQLAIVEVAEPSLAHIEIMRQGDFIDI